MYDLIVVGGGAAGFYGAIHAARMAPGLRVAIFEKSPHFLSKVRISGGGRCNVTHRPMDPQQLVSHYPRGGKELLGPFYTHSSEAVMFFFEELGVGLKTEADGRVFPKTDRSESITQALFSEAGRLSIELFPKCGVADLRKSEEAPDLWEVETPQGNFRAKHILLAPGGSKPVWRLLKAMGCKIVPPVPSLFTFRIADERLEGLQGISSPAEIEVVAPPEGTPLVGINTRQLFRHGGLSGEGPLLVTHWGLSGPSILKLSAWGARYFAAVSYRFKIRINWLPEYHKGGIPQLLEKIKNTDGSKTVSRSRSLPLPGRLWKRLVEASGIDASTRWADLSRSLLRRLAEQLTASEFEVDGKSTYKEEFVTSGGLSLKEIDFRTFELKKHPGLFAAGEVLDIDAVTGGFNFQNAWTGSYIAAVEMAARSRESAQKEVQDPGN